MESEDAGEEDFEEVDSNIMDDDWQLPDDIPWTIYQLYLLMIIAYYWLLLLSMWTLTFDMTP